METETKEKIDLLAKIIDALYKKIIIMIAIAGGFGAYAISFIKQGNIYGYFFAFIFIFASVAIFISYVKLNICIKELENIRNG